MSDVLSSRDIERMAFEARAEKVPLTDAMRRALRRDRKRWLALYGGSLSSSQRLRSGSGFGLRSRIGLRAI